MFVNLKWDLYAVLVTSMVVCMPTMYFLQLFAVCQGMHPDLSICCPSSIKSLHYFSS